MKDKFISVTSHELRTPLTSILGGISLLKNMGDQELTSNARKLIDIASRNGERLLSLINDILDVQSLSEGTVSLNRQNINLNELINSTVENCVDFTKQYNVQYSIENLDNELRVIADKTRISQVLTIFLSNAAKFTSSGDVVQIRVRKVNQWAQVNIVDHGPGITSEEQVNLFSRFHQVNPGTSGPQKSSGLGLSISKQLIELHEGKIGFKLGENRGSTFWFALPLA